MHYEVMIISYGGYEQMPLAGTFTSSRFIKGIPHTRCSNSRDGYALMQENHSLTDV